METGTMYKRNQPHLRLRELMSDISEDCYAAGWMSGLEFSLWKVVLENKSVGGYMVNKENIAKLRKLSEQAGGWWYWPDHKGKLYYCIFVEMDDWLKIYSRYNSKCRCMKTK